MSVCVKSEREPDGIGWVAYWRYDGRHRRWFRLDEIFHTSVDAQLAASRVWLDARNKRITEERRRRNIQAKRVNREIRRREQRQ